MTGRGSWIIENHRYRQCPRLERGVRSFISIHNHSAYSVESLSSLNHVVAAPPMRPFSRMLQNAFGLGDISDLDYADLQYNPPLMPADVFRVEAENAQRAGFEHTLFALTDHNTVGGCLELLGDPATGRGHIGMGEELSVCFLEHVFHLGVVGLPVDSFVDIHEAVYDAACEGRLENLFETLRDSGCLVVLNHPMLPWNGSRRPIPVLEFLTRFGWAIDALEYNGMRSRRENDAVLKLARETGKPLVGGGDSHFLTPGSVAGFSREALTVSEYIQEVKGGNSSVIIFKEYFAPMEWKIFLRVIGFIAQYREIACYKGAQIESVIGKRFVILDGAGALANGCLRIVRALGLMR